MIEERGKKDEKKAEEQQRRRAFAIHDVRTWLVSDSMSGRFCFVF